MQSTSTVFSQVRARINSGSCNSEGDKDVFGQRPALWKLFYYSPKKAEALKVIQAVLGFTDLKIVKPRITLGGSRMSVELGQYAGNCLHCCKTFHTYNSHLDMQRYMVYTPFWLELMVYQKVNKSY